LLIKIKFLLALLNSKNYFWNLLNSSANSYTMQNKFILFFVAILFLSCRKDNYENITTDTTLRPIVALPLVNSTLEIKELISALDSDYIKSDENGQLILVFSDTLVDLKLEDLMEIPNQTQNYAVNLEAISIPNQSIAGGISLDDASDNFEPGIKTLIKNSNNTSIIIPFPSGIMDIGNYSTSEAFEEFNYADFESGDITIELTNGWNVNLQNLKMALVNVPTGLPVDTFDFGSLNTGETKIVTRSLANKRLYSDLEVRIFSIEVLNTNSPVLIDLSQTLSYSCKTENLKVIGGSIRVTEAQQLNEEEIVVPFSFQNGEEIDKIVIKSGSFDFDINYGIKANASIEISIPAVTKNNVAFNEIINLNSDYSNPTLLNKAFSLDGYEVDLTKINPGSNELKINVKPTILTSSQYFDFSINDQVSVDVELNNMKIKLLEGYFGNSTVNITQNTADLDFGNNDFLEYFSFKEPVIKLLFDNGLGLPLGLNIDLNLEGKNGNEDLDLSSKLNNFVIAGSPSYGQMVTSTLVIDNQTNIVEAMEVKPNKATIGGSVVLNPAGKIKNFAQDTSKLRVRVDLEIPLYGTVDNYVFLDTLEQDMSEILKNVEDVVLKTTIINDLPINGSIQLYFADENYVILDSISNNKRLLIGSAITNSNGDLVSSTKLINDFELDKEKIERIKATKHIIFSTLVTSREDLNGAIAGRIYDFYKMQIKLAIKAQTNFNLNTNED